MSARMILVGLADAIVEGICAELRDHGLTEAEVICVRVLLRRVRALTPAQMPDGAPADAALIEPAGGGDGGQR